MPVHSAAAWLGRFDLAKLAYACVGCTLLWTLKSWTGGRRTTCERDWAGKMILVVAEPNSTTYSLIHTLLHLPRPPQILFLPPTPSPLPEEMLTILHTIRLSASSSPLAQLHCEPLPRTPEGVAAFTQKWGTPMKGTVGEGGRRIDAIVLGSGWEIDSAGPGGGVAYDGDVDGDGADEGKEKEKDKGKGKAKWTIHQHHYHLLTSLLPTLLRAPAERSIRIIALASPAWSAAIPSIQGITPPRAGPLAFSAIRGINTLLVMAHFQLILDTLASAAYGSAAKGAVPVPDPNEPNAKGKGKGKAKKREEGLKSNIMALSVIMPWTRDQGVRGAMGADEGWLGYLFYILAYPLLLFLTPSPSRAIQSILFALSAPIRYNPAPGEKVDETQSRRSAVSGGDVVRDCAFIDLPPALRDPALAKANYEALEREVEERIKLGSGGAGGKSG